MSCCSINKITIQNVTITSIKDPIIKNLHRIIIGQINISSIRNKFDMLWQYCQNNLDILLIRKTKLDRHIWLHFQTHTFISVVIRHRIDLIGTSLEVVFGYM